MPDLESWSLPKALAEAIFTSELGHTYPASVYHPSTGKQRCSAAGGEGGRAGGRLVTGTHQAFLSLLILPWAVISSEFGIWAAKPRCPASPVGGAAGLGWLQGLRGTAPRLRGISQAAVQLEPLGWGSLKQQTLQNKGMFHCFFLVKWFPVF